MGLNADSNPLLFLVLTGLLSTYRRVSSEAVLSAVLAKSGLLDPREHRRLGGSELPFFIILPLSQSDVSRTSNFSD